MPFEYSSETATDSGQCTGAECPDPVITITPVEPIGVPTFVLITSSVPGAIIRYTIDGTDPDTLSTQYTGPFSIQNTGITVKAIAYLEDCEPAPVAINAVFQNPPFPFQFSYACDTPDNAGQWGVFVPNSTEDWHWRLQLILSSPVTIKRLEIYQLDAVGAWTTGQVWSTDSPITTPLAAANPFACFPLLLFIGAVQQFAAYQSSLGSFGPGTITFDLYGDQAFPAPATNFFRVEIILSDDTRLSQTITAECTSTPTLCPAPDAPTLNPVCLASVGRVDATFTVTIGRAWKLYAALQSCGGTGVFSQIASGTGTGGVQTVQHTGLQEGCTYAYYLSVDLVGCGFRDSNSVSVQTLIFPTVSVSTDKAIVDPGETFTISWDSSQLHTTVCNGCLAGEIKTPFGCKPGNTSGSQLTSEAVCGIYAYEVSGCNPCASAIATVHVEVRCAAECGVANPITVTVSNPTTFACPIDGACAAGNRCGIVWNGQMARQGGADSCAYLITDGDTQGIIGGCLQPDLPCGLPVMGSIVFNSSLNRWVIQLRHPVESVIYFEGEKAYGSNALGTYTKTGGCSGLSSLTVT